MVATIQNLTHKNWVIKSMWVESLTPIESLSPLLLTHKTLNPKSKSKNWVIKSHWDSSIHIPWIFQFFSKSHVLSSFFRRQLLGYRELRGAHGGGRMWAADPESLLGWGAVMVIPNCKSGLYIELYIYWGTIGYWIIYWDTIWYNGFMLKDFFLGQFYGSESNRPSRLNSQYSPWDGMGPLYNESFGTSRSVKTYMNIYMST